ncbi:MAG: ABC transporter permease [Gemmatimonadales bacterium]
MPSLKLAVRTLARSPFVTAVAVGSLALGIGANTGLFSMFQQILLRPLQVEGADRLVNLSSPGPKSGSTSCNDAGSCDEVFSYPMFRDLEAGQKVLAGLAAHRSFGANLAYQGLTLDSEGLYVSGSYFSVLGLRPALGRLIGPSDDRVIGGHPVAVLSHRYWQDRLGADSSVIGQALTINGQFVTVVGVAPAGFDGTTIGIRPRVFVPISMRGVLSSREGSFQDRNDYWIYLFGRLAPGGTLVEAAAGLNAIYRPIVAEVELPLQTNAKDDYLERFRAKEIGVAPGRRGQTQIGREATAPLLLLFTVTGIVLLIACINVANLLIARAANRAHEMAVRLSLGATRRQLIAQLLTESLLLAALAGVVSLVVARWTLALITRFLPPDALATVDFSVGGAAIAFAAAAALVTGLLFGVAPAIHATRPELLGIIKANAGRTTGNRGGARFGSGLVTAQIGLSMALLATAGLFIRSLGNAARVDLGLEADNVVSFRIAPSLNGYPPARINALYRRVEEELAALPGVAEVAAARVPVLAGSSWNTTVKVEGYEPEPEERASASYNQVGPGFLSTLGMRLLAGREFTDADAVGGPRVAMVTESFVRRFNLGRDVIGKRIGVGDGELDIEIVGLVRDAKYNEVKGATPPVFFRPYRQDTLIGSINFYARTRGTPTALLREIPRMMGRVDPTLPVVDLITLPAQIQQGLSVDRLIGNFSSAFAALATLLASIGLYGVLAYNVARRTREIGVRMALGADRRRVRGLVLRQVGRMLLIGGGIGLLVAIAIGQAARSLLFDVQGYDPFALAGATALLALVAFSAGYLPARRASAVHPMEALREE